MGIFARESVCGAHMRTQDDHPFNMKVLEKESPTSLTVEEFMRVLYIRKIFVVSNNGNGERGALKIMFPLKKSKNNCKEFVVINIIVAFGEEECFREVSQGCRSPLASFCMRTVPKARREASVMMKRGREVFGME